jgi:hypothetical protein
VLAKCLPPLCDKGNALALSHSSLSQTRGTVNGQQRSSTTGQRTGSVASGLLHEAFHRAGQVDLDDSPFQLVEIHVIDGILSVRCGAIGDESEAAMFRFC